MGTFAYSTTVKMRNTDAAGIIFFGSQFEMAHDAYEALLESLGFSFAALLRDLGFFIPIVHAEADYKAPLFVGDKITVEVKLNKIGTSSFVVSYVLRSRSKKIVGTAQTVHVTVNGKTHKKIPLPPRLRQALKKLL